MEVNILIMIKKIELNKYSEITSKLYLDEEFKLLIGKFEGLYRNGSKGNLDGLYIFSKLNSIYFLYDTISVVLCDFRALNYSYGNTLLKSLNYFNEIGRDLEEKRKKVVVVLSENNEKSIKDLLKFINASTCICFLSYEDALSYANDAAVNYLEG